jgi:hypothetical protein
VSSFCNATLAHIMLQPTPSINSTKNYFAYYLVMEWVCVIDGIVKFHFVVEHRELAFDPNQMNPKFRS